MFVGHEKASLPTGKSRRTSKHEPRAGRAHCGVGALFVSLCFAAGAVPELARATEADLRVDRLEIGDHRTVTLKYAGTHLVFVGLQQCPPVLPCVVSGVQRFYRLDGSLSHQIKLGPSRTLQFEGVAHLVRQVTEFNEQEQVTRRWSAHRCTECDWSPAGVWRWYRNGKVIRSVDMSRLSSAQVSERDWQDANRPELETD